MTTNRAAAMEAGFEQAVKAYFDEAIKVAAAGHATRALETQRSSILTTRRGMGDMLAILDEQYADYLMKVSIAQFYTGWGPDTWKPRAKHPLYPYKNNAKHATKGAIDQWVLACIEGKHPGELNAMSSPDWGRDPSTWHPYLIDTATGVVVCDGLVCGISKDHVAAVAQSGGEIRIHRLDEALSQPWQNNAMRRIWAKHYRRFLVDMTKLADKQLAAFDKSQVNVDLQRKTVPARGKGKPNRI